MFSNIKKIIFSLCLFILTAARVFADPGDTIKVQTFTFGSPQDAWFELPGLDVSIEKIIMKYTLKCNPLQSPACGEWDYLTYNYLYEHTGELDSTLLLHPFFTANGAEPDTFSFSDDQTYTTVPYWEYFIVHDDTISLNNYTIGTSDAPIYYPFYTAYPISRSQFIWRASELTAAGMVAGNITGLDFDILSAGYTMQHLKIKMKTTISDEFSTNIFETGVALTVYDQTTTFSIGNGAVDFLTPFYWDGVSNILIEVTYQNNDFTGLSYLTGAQDPGFTSALTTSSYDKYIEFYNPDYADVIGNPLSDLSEQVTVSFWSQGDAAYQPQNGTTFEATTISGARVLNSHTPWSDTNVYWDAGNDGGYDRINKVSVAADFETNWTHWAFTKNTVTGSMKIYKNGILWHSGTGTVKLMEDIMNLRLGKGAWGGSESYAGNMDEFAIWNVELDAATINDYLYKDLDALHPYNANLLLYYHFNDGDGLTEPDEVSGNDLGMVGAVTRYYNAEKLFRNITANNYRPTVSFEQGEFADHTDSLLIINNIPTDPITLIYFDPSDPTVATDTVLVYPSDFYSYTYNADGSILDSVLITATSTIYNEDLEYYSAPFEIINTIELGRFITPYGIGLDLGDGFTWTYDVSDYRPLLHDSVHLNAGNWQELLDMELLFIEGTPPRDPISVSNLWFGFYGYGLTPSFNDLTPVKEITIPNDAVNSRVKIRVTGHGFGGTANCAEFCSREHTLSVDGASVWNKEVWRDNCDVNPVYPQGGTWVYDRANWCPGAEVWTYDHELTQDVVPGNTYDFDYNAEDYTWNGAGSVPTYVTSVQLVTYGAPNFILDASLEEIISPSDNDMHSRKNPVCTNPVIVIKNTGSTNLTSLDISFGIKDQVQTEYTWTGELAFMESEEVTLPNFGWTNAGTEFSVVISNPNGGTDEYAFNNAIISKMAIPPTYPSDFYLETKTNTASHENDLFVYDHHGNTIFERTTFEDNSTYKDTLHLEEGCYELYLWDYGEDGLSWWANSDGSGFFRTRDMDGSFIKSFETDFGGLIYLQFTVGNYNDINDEFITKDEVNLYPNPTQNEIFVDLDMAHLSDVDLSIADITGKIIHNEKHDRIQNETLRIDMSAQPSGIYMVLIRSGEGLITKQFVLDK
ncbi:MAG: T9SS type A sorting domain-containing protein [Bacteroidetes bacterium]|jgi:hypothetical protein|nr:T9SS type A sorting domain-containing protein [Bacteroidota bacterium]